MKNKEKFVKKIVEIACSGNSVAKIKGMLCCCEETDCSDCDFSDLLCNCQINIKKWAEAEYIEYETDWAKVSVDTPVIVKRSDCEYRYYFEKLLSSERLSVFCDGSTSWSSLSYKVKTISYPVSSVTLDREEDKIKYRKVKEV